MPFNILAAVVGLIIALTTSQLTDVGALAPPGSNYTRICGGVNIPYPFGLEPDCAMPGFNLTCEKTTDGSLSEIYENICLCMEEINFLGEDLRETPPPALLIPHTSYCAHPGWTASERGLRRGRATEDLLSYLDYLDYMELVEEANFTFRMSYLDSSPLPYLPLYQVYMQPRYLDWAADGFVHFSGTLDEEANFTFWTRYLNSSALVIDWAIGNATCDVAQQNPDYACVSSNSECVHSPSVRGYICNCSEGFQGNPYLQDPEHGCKERW